MEKGNKRWLISFYHLEIKTVTGVVITLGRWWRCSVTPLQPAHSSHPARSPPPCKRGFSFLRIALAGCEKRGFAEMPPPMEDVTCTQGFHGATISQQWAWHETQSFPMDTAMPPEIQGISRTSLLGLQNTFLLVQYCISITSWAHAIHKYKLTGRISGSWLFSSDLHPVSKII